MSPKSVQEQAAALVASGNSGIAESLRGLSEKHLLALRAANSRSVSSNLAVDPTTDNLTVGLGRYIYIRMSPQDQQFVVAAGAAGVIALVCAATDGVGCVVAGFFASTLVAWVQSYGQSRCWVEVKVTYAGQFAGLSKVYNCN